MLDEQKKKELNENEMNQVTGGASDSQEDSDPIINNGDVLSEILNLVGDTIEENQGMIDVMNDLIGMENDNQKFVFLK